MKNEYASRERTVFGIIFAFKRYKKRVNKIVFEFLQVENAPTEILDIKFSWKKFPTLF